MKTHLVTTLIIMAISTPSLASNVDKDSAAYKVAEAVNYMVRSVRSIYTGRVLSKLKEDGAGASQQYHTQKGFIPLPAQFVRDVGESIRIKGQKSGQVAFTYTLRSKWNLNDLQGLDNSFLKKGWAFLEEQQIEATKNGVPLENIEWKPYVAVEKVNGKDTLRYFAADVASAAACVSCHNKWEQKEEIKEERELNDVAPGKVFKLWELMGAVNVDVPLK